MHQLETGSRHHFEVTLRADTAWIDAFPTLDAEPGVGLSVYPGSARDLPPITVDEYQTFVSLVPTRDQWTTDCRPGVQQMNAWISSHVYGSGAGIRPFGHVAEALVGACEQQIQSIGNSLLQRGVSPLPASLRSWADQNSCAIESDLATQSSCAIPGRFMPETPEEQWAVLCARASGWRLLVIHAPSGTVLAELVSSVGRSTQHALSVAPPQYFHWAQIYDPSQLTALFPAPEHDAIILDEFAYFWQDGRWTAAWSECCYFAY